MLYMLWNECAPNNFYKDRCKNRNFIYLSGKNVLYPKTSGIFWKLKKTLKTTSI